MLGRQEKLNPVCIKINDDPNFGWLPTVQAAIKAHNEVILYCENEPLNGIVGFINCLRREPDIKNVKAVALLDGNKSFDANDPFISEQLKKNLALNIYKNGQWGTYRHIQIENTVEVKTHHVFVNQLTTGDLSSLRWMAGPISDGDSTKIPPEHKLVEVRFNSVIQ